MVVNRDRRAQRLAASARSLTLPEGQRRRCAVTTCHIHRNYLESVEKTGSFSSIEMQHRRHRPLQSHQERILARGSPCLAFSSNSSSDGWLSSLLEPSSTKQNMPQGGLQRQLTEALKHSLGVRQGHVRQRGVSSRMARPSRRAAPAPRNPAA